MTYQQFLLAAVCALVLIGCASPPWKDKAVGTSAVGTSAVSSAEVSSKTQYIPPLPGLGSLSR